VAVTGVRADDGTTLFDVATEVDGSYAATFDVATAPDEVTITATADGFESSEETVAFAEELTVDLALAVSTVEVTVSGTVTDAETGDPVEGAALSGVRPDTDAGLFNIETGIDGTYEAVFEVEAGDEPSEITVEASADGFDSSEATVAFAEELSVDFQLEAKTTSSTVSGTVTREDTGDPVDEAFVTGTNSQTGTELFEVQTDAEGTYEATFEVRVLDEPAEVELSFANPDYEESALTVAFEEDIVADVALQPLELAVSISGVVTAEEDGSTVEGATVRALNQENDEYAATETGPSGDYGLSFVALAPDVPEELILRAEESKFDDMSTVVDFSVSFTTDLVLPSIPISNIIVLQEIGKTSDFPSNGYYIQITNIDASDTEFWDGGKGFEPIGNELVSFSGVYNGNEFNITDLTVNRPGLTNAGLFGLVSDGIIRNVNVISSSIRGGQRHVGGIVGYGNPAIVESSHFNGTVVGGTDVGGLIGRNRLFGSRIESSGSSGIVEGGSIVGGLIGMNQSDIYQSYSTSNVSGNGKVGGFCGWCNSRSVNTSFSTGSVSGTNEVGGFAGSNGSNGSQPTVVKNSYSTGFVSGDNRVGGLVGRIWDDGEVRSSYGTGEVNGNDFTAGLVGVNSGLVTNSYWDTETTGQADGIGGGIFNGATGLTTSEMQGAAAEQNMDRFDFVEIWRTVTGDYPALWWEE
jgi:hypothetical protein